MKNITLLFFLLINGIMFSQKTERDVVHLKSGSIVKGKITEMNPSENLKIQTADGSLFVYAMTDVIRMEKEEFVGKEMNQQTSDIVSHSSLKKVFIDYLIKNRPAIRFVGVAKKNGIKREIYGQKIYQIEYELILETKQTIFINDSQLASAFSNKFITDFSYTTRDASGYEAALSASKKKLIEGQRILVQGSIAYEQTDNGWRSTGFTNENFKIVSENYLPPALANQKAEDQAKFEKSLKSKLDWKKSDTKRIDFSPHYFSQESIPLFENGNCKLLVTPTADYKGRNDALMKIRNSVYNSFNATQRFTKSDENSFALAQNSTEIEFSVLKTDFELEGAGYRCQIVARITTNGTYSNPQMVTFNNKTTITAFSSIFSKNLTKPEALTSAIKKLQKEVKKYIFKNKPVKLEFIRVEANEKGKVNKVVLRKPNQFISINKLKFKVINPSGITIENGRYILTDAIGECVFNGEIIGDEIICSVKGGRNKKAFEKLLYTKQEYVAISSY